MSRIVEQDKIVDVYKAEKLIGDGKPWYDVVPDTTKGYADSWIEHFRRTGAPYVMTRRKIRKQDGIRSKYTIWIRFKPLAEKEHVNVDPPFNDFHILKFATTEKSK